MIFRAENISKAYNNHIALNQVNLSVEEGKVFGLLGPNGAGKTTFIRIINQITAPDQGQIFINGEKLRPHHVHDIGYLPEERGLYKKMKIKDQAIYLAQLKGLSKKEAIHRLNFWFEKFQIKDWFNKTVEELSKGMAQKVQFITTAIHNPKILILDEPFSGFDPINASLIKDEILELRNNGTSIFLSTHNMDSVELICDHIGLLNKSELILNGALRDLKKEFSKGIFEIYTEKGDTLQDMETGLFTIESELKKETTNITTIKLSDNISLNQVLSYIIDKKISLKGVREIIPTANDIFIEAVGQSNINSNNQEQYA